MHYLTLILLLFGGPQWLGAATSPAVDPKAKLDLPAAKKECENGHLGVCMRLGMHYEKLGKDKEAVGFYTMACDGDDVPSCLQLAKFAESKQDQRSAMKWLRRACRSNKGDGTGCFQIATYAVAMNSPANAKMWYKKACNKGHKKSCQRIKSENKNGTTKDPGKTKP